jgi:cytochrome c oxidase subunit II
VSKSRIIWLVLLGVAMGGIATVVALFIPWLPELGSEQGKRIDDVYTLTTIICLVIFAVVAAWLLYSIVKFRARPDDDEDGKPIHGHTGLEAFWTAVPAALVTVIAIYSGIVLVKNEDLPANYRVVEVKAQQFAWSFTYPDLGITTGVLRLPENQIAQLKMESDDVIHSFWVPQWRVKQDVVPGTVQTIVVTPTKRGTFPLICTELCGLGHSVMRTSAVVLTKADFDSWVQEQKRASTAGGGSEGKQVFANAGCGACHTLADAGSTAQVGPELDKVLPELTADQVRESIVDPNAVITPGYQGGVMPQDFGQQLTAKQLDALVTYLKDATKG